MNTDQNKSNNPYGRKMKIEKIILPMQEFIKTESSSSILLILFMLAALFWANSPWKASYAALWSTEFSIGLGSFSLSKPLLLWINDGLMAVFFFVIGLEIKREILVGELSSLKKAMLPVAAALGGILIPALIYVVFNNGKAGQSGWGIPMATDIAFALGILALIGNKVPVQLKIFLTALAIVDDISAVLVIAIFYSEKIIWMNLVLAALVFMILVLLNRLGVRKPAWYILFGIILWLATLKSGVHATVAGILLALTIPASTKIDTNGFITRTKNYLQKFEEYGPDKKKNFTTKEQRALLQTIEDGVHLLEAPLQRLEHLLHPWVAFFIMPVFALANAGISLQISSLHQLFDPVTLGIAAGLFIGKQAGIVSFSWLAIKTGLASKMEGVTWQQIYGASLLAGIGFTMALFITNLAFVDPDLINKAKTGILIASLLSGITGWLVLRNTRKVIKN